MLFQFFSERYERGSVLITTNLEFSRWTEVFQDVSLAAALLDRLTHHSHVLLFNGESYRFSKRVKKRCLSSRGGSLFGYQGEFLLD